MLDSLLDTMDLALCDKRFASEKSLQTCIRSHMSGKAMDATSNRSSRLRRPYRYGKSLCRMALSEEGKMWLGHLSLIEWLTCTLD